MGRNKSIKKYLIKSCRSRYALLLLFLSPMITKAQRLQIYNNGVWTGYYTNTELGKEYSLVTEMELKTKEWTSRWHEMVVDIGVAKKLNQKWKIASGGAWYSNAQYFDELFFKNEWRLWQEAGYNLSGKKLAFVQKV